MEQALISRYCGIEDSHCDQEISYQGDGTYFFAYPSGSHWQDFSSQLRDELASRGINGRRWEDVVQGELIFCKVCKGIHSHDMLVAEVTEANANVLLETGYAMAVGRLPILLIDQNRKRWDRRLLSTLESCYYTNREEIYDHISKVQAEYKNVSQRPSHRLPMLESTGLFDREETPGTVYHLKPKIITDQIKRIDRVLKTSVFKPTSMDPNDSVYDEFLPQVRKIHEAQLIVASFVSTDHTNAEELNANVALLVGFALGLGKHILVLQQNPAPPILDLGTVLRPFDTESEARKIAESWLDERNREIVSKRSGIRQIVAKQTKARALRGMYLGHPDALQDYNLMEYFVPTKEYDDAITARRSIFIGRRGSGKSANFRAVTTELQENLNTILVTIAPDDFELDRMGGFLDDEYAIAHPDLVYQTAWNYVFLTEIIRVLGESTLRLYSSPSDPTRTSLFDFYQTERENLHLDFGSRLIRKLRDLSSIRADMSADEKRQQIEATVLQLRHHKVGQLLRDFAKAEKISYFIAVDDLDKHWRPESHESIGLLLGLLAEVDKLQRYFLDSLKIVLFLREDMYEVLLQHDEELPKRNLLRMQWTISNLKHLVAERIAVGAGTGNEDDEDTWLSLFCPHVQNQVTHEYIISRVLPRPRDVLDFCQKAIDQAQRNGHEIVTTEDVLDAEADFSESLFRSIGLEYKTVYPKIDDVLLEFVEARHIMAWQEYEKLGEVILTKHRNVIKTWYGAVNPDTLYLSSVLFRIGFIGLVQAGRQLSLFADGRSFRETWSLVRPTPQVEIHPAFHRVLEIRGEGVPLASGRRRRKSVIDDRQMRLDLDAESNQSGV